MAFSQHTALEFLRRAHQQQRLAHAYLITGPAGSGKRSLAIQIAEMVNPAVRERGGSRDLHIAEPESKSRRIVVEQIRELEKELQMRSSSGARKVGIIFDADRLQVQASNAFLKTLEEPPNNSLLLLVTSQPQMLLDTIISRCIPLQLSTATKPPLSPAQLRLLELLERYFEIPGAGLPQIFGLVREFTLLLQERRKEIQEETAAELKKEQALYKQATDSAKWLEEREEYFKALNESRYVQQRFALVDTLLQWWADVLRLQNGGPELDYPGQAAATERLAVLYPTHEVLARISQLEELRENLNRNVQEQLALEVAFLKAFGPPEKAA